jgi:hypothetical protein
LYALAVNGEGMGSYFIRAGTYISGVLGLLAARGLARLGPLLGSGG